MLNFKKFQMKNEKFQRYKLTPYVCNNFRYLFRINNITLRYSLKQINLSVQEPFSSDSHSSKRAHNFQKGAPDLPQLVEGGASAPSTP